MIALVVGLEAEARIARRLGPTFVGGGGAAGAAEAARRATEAGATALVSFGLAGGLSPALAAGDLLVPARILLPDGATIATDPALSRRLGHPSGVLLAGTAILATAAEKARAHALGADAVDLETGALLGLGLPVAALRAICDPAGRDLPHAALHALDPAGRVRPGALAGDLLRRPGQIPALIALGREAATARRALLARVATLGPLRVDAGAT